MPDRGTIIAWLSLTAAVDREDDAVRSLLAQCPVPLAVIDLVEQVVTVASPRFCEVIGAEDVPPGTALAALVPPADRITALSEMLLDGTIDAFEGQRTLRRLDGTRTPATSWVTVLDLVERGRAVWVLAPDDGEVIAPVPPPRPSSWPQAVAGVVVGVLDGTLNVLDISRSVEEAFGYLPDDVIGQPAIGFVHAEDVHLLLTGIARALTDCTGFGTELRIRDRDGRWCPMHTMVVPFDGDDLRIGFSVVPVAIRAPRLGSGGAGPPSEAEAEERADHLERRLRRISEELRAAGFGSGTPDVRAPRELPELADLSARQWEILERLLRGERVPGIASRLFISQSTVRNHLTAVFRRLGVNSQEELMTLLTSGRPVEQLPG